MKLAIIGLGKMGANIALNLIDHGYEVVGFDKMEIARENARKQNIETVDTLEELLAALPERKVIWMMVPSGAPTEECVNTLAGMLNENDILIDAGNSNYKDSMRRAESVGTNGIHYMDIGTSGGTSGAREGACLMIGGRKEDYDYLEKVFDDISIKDGQLYTGVNGSGHFMKMVHNGIEYGMMQAMGEGFQLMKESPFEYDLEKVAKNWNNGSVIRGWLMELAESQFRAHPNLEDIKGVVDASGEAKWTVETALDLEVAVPVIALSLMTRNKSKDEDKFSCRVVSALRNGFGGHSFTKDEK